MYVDYTVFSLPDKVYSWVTDITSQCTFVGFFRPLVLFSPKYGKYKNASIFLIWILVWSEHL